jgi:prephenate dehydratase
MMKAMSQRGTTDRYAYLGPPGTFCEAAVGMLDEAAGAERVPYPTIQTALDAVRTGQAERGVVPIENSVEGAVTATLDDLATGAELIICAEVLLGVAFALLVRPGTQLADIKLLGGHPVAQPQCRHWLASNLPDVEWRPASSNAEGARQVAEGQLDAALAGAFTAELYGLTVLASDIHDRDSAVTRFVVLRRPGPLPPVTGGDRTSVIAFLADDHPGALMEILGQFAAREVNLTRIESRPTGEQLGKYCFFIDCEGHVTEARVGEALMGLHRVCSDVRFLGSYPRQDGGRSQVRAGTSEAAFAGAAGWLTRLRHGQPGRS